MEYEQKLNTLIFTLTLYFQIMLKSGWDYLLVVPLWKYIGYALYGVMLGLIFVNVWKLRLHMRQISFLLAYILFVFFFLSQGNLSVATVFLFGAYAYLTMDVGLVLFSYLAASILGLFSAFWLSVFNVLPIYNQTINYWVFGFKNPNNISYYLLLIFAIQLVRKWEKPGLPIFVFLLGSCILNKYVLHNYTALVVSFFLVVLWLLITFIPKFFQMHPIEHLIVLSPLIFALFSYLVGHFFGKFNILYKLNRIFTLRPAIWHFYLSNYTPRLFGTSIPEHITAYNGAFDGMFLYYPYQNGMIISIVLLFLVMFGLHNLLRQRNFAIVSLMLVLLIYGLSENSPSIIYSSPLFAIALMYAIPTNDIQEITNPKNISSLEELQ